MQKTIQRGLSTLRQQGWAAFSLQVRAWLRRRLPGTAASAVPAAQDYLAWAARTEPDAAELARQAQAAQIWASPPLISVVMPVYNPDPAALRAALDSLLQQTYPHWQACIADGGSHRPGVRQVLEEFAARDARLRLAFLEANRGISANSNAALEMARGEFTAFLDHDDLLAPFALFEVAQAVQQQPECDLLYSDHDLLSAADGQRTQPLFKPDWSPEIMLSSNYITHLTVARTALLRRVGGFDPALDAAQDWDLFLRLSEQARRIHHIPKVLYHWRASPASTAEGIWQKPEAPAAQTRAVARHLQRLGLPGAQAFFDPSGYLRAKWDFDRTRKVSIIIPSRGPSRLLKACVGSILRHTQSPHYEIIIVNNGPQRPEQSTDYRRLSADPRLRILHMDGPFNYSAANNLGARQASGEILVFLNNDTQVLASDWLDELSMWAQRPEVGAVGAKLIHPRGVIQHAGVILGLSGFAGHIFGGLPENTWGLYGRAEWYRDYLAVTAACLALRREAFEQAGGFDESMQLCGSDVALCLQLRHAGLRIVYNPFVRLLHHEGATRQRDVPAQDYHCSYPYYLPYLRQGDPYFNPNLSYWQLTPALAAAGEPAPLTFVEDFLRRLEPPA